MHAALVSFVLLASLASAINKKPNAGHRKAPVHPHASNDAPAHPHAGNNAPSSFLHKKVKDNKRPNILFLMSDSMDGRLVDSSSNESLTVDMPFLRGFLSQNGANFVRSYSNNPMCVPSRTSMMTGRRSDVINVWGNEQGLAANPNGVLDDTCVLRLGEEHCQKIADEQGRPETILSTFQKLGYNVHMEGRLHIGAGMLNEQAHDGQVEGRATCEAFDSTRAGEVTRSADIRKSPGAIFQKTFVDGALEAGGDTNFAIADWLAMKSCKEWISELPSPSELEKPFFLHCSLNLPHYSFSTNSTWLQSVHEEHIKVPTWNPGFPEEWHPYDSFMSMAKGVDTEFEESDIKKLRRVYYGMVAEADNMLSGVWDALVQKGYSLNNTYVIYVSDHGELKFEHRQVYKASMYEGSVRIPMQIAGPGVKKGKHIESHLTSLVDVFPTLLDMARIEDEAAYSGLNGQSLLAAAGAKSVAPANKKLGGQVDKRDFVLSQYNWVEANTGIFMVRSGPWKYMSYGHTYRAYKNYKPQLFNVDEDPEELNNVAAENPEIVQKMDAQLRETLDPEEVDRKVMKEDYQRLLERYEDSGTSADERAVEMLKLVPRDYSRKFTDWLAEAKGLFGN